MTHKVFTEERHQKMLDFINSRERVKVEDLAKHFNVTETTIRRDLITLEKMGFIYRAHGGAFKREQQSIWQLISLQTRLSQYAEEKERIALQVSLLIRDGESLMIDGGSTTVKVTQKLCERKNLLVVTNALTIGELFAGSNSNKVILTGGELLRETNALTGNAAEYVISKYRADKAIIGVSGLIPSEGCFAAIPNEGAVKNLMLQNSREKIIVTDSSKIGVQAFYFFYDIKNIDILVTDKNIKKEDLSNLKKAGVEVFVV
ncbi:MAG: DeoR/GlpR family DNA-binding transcription regulator [Treponema sp.]|jgi:DeoR/GlpR family transcriptional regulator of sugar metabolism|nr:DeoR/GlpR family DNA-binding transcription regulator [Treponema sp.]